MEALPGDGEKRSLGAPLVKLLAAMEKIPNMAKMVPRRIERENIIPRSNGFRSIDSMGV
jgi:hypothetical protein